MLTPASYLSGESSAILRGLTGGPVLPAFARQPAAVAGYHGRPALVQNVETLARIGLLARTGARAYRPTALVTVTSQASRTVLELDQDATVGDAVRLSGWRGSRRRRQFSSVGTAGRGCPGQSLSAFRFATATFAASARAWAPGC